MIPAVPPVFIMSWQGEEEISLAFPGYQILDQIGQGGMGEVYLARRHQDGSLVALKLLRDVRGSEGAELRQRFQREIQLLLQLHHPNIVTILDHGTAQGRDYYSMTYLPGGSLRTLLDPGPLPSLERSRAILAQVCRGLHFLAEKSILHRDLKPENILLDEEGQVLITDFGISARETEVGNLTQTENVLGTSSYMSPEQRANLPLDSRSDQFSLAVLAYELLTGRCPAGRFPPASQLRPGLSSRVDTVLARALEQDPEARFPSIGDMARSLDVALSAGRKRPGPGKLLLTLMVAAVIGGLAWLAWPRSKSSLISAPATDPTLAKPGPAKAELATSPLPPPDQETLDRVRYFVQLAERHLARGHGADAETALNQALGLAPEDAVLYLRRGLVFKKRGLYAEALKDMLEATQRAPENADTHIGLGSIYSLLKDYPLALTALNRAIELAPRAADAHAYRGWVHHCLQHETLAEGDLQEAVALDPDCGLAHQFRALRAQKKKAYAQAIVEFRESIRCTPDEPYARHGLAYLLATCSQRDLRNGKEALVHARKAAELTSYRDWQILRVLAAAHHQAGETDQAIIRLEQALSLAPATVRRSLESQLGFYRKQSKVSPGARHHES